MRLLKQQQRTWQGRKNKTTSAASSGQPGKTPASPGYNGPMNKVDILIKKQVLARD
jgi:hypothetical protein